MQTEELKFLKIKTQKIELPNKKRTQIEFIEHLGAALMIPFLSDGEIIFIKQYRPVIEKFIYELPAGTIDPGENPLETAKRELIEEIGYEAKVWQKLGEIFLCPGYSTEKIFIFKASSLAKNNSRSQGETEIIETITMKKTDVKKLFETGELQDSKTIAALVHCGWL